MKCPICGHTAIPEDMTTCPQCRVELPKAHKPPTQIKVTQEVGTVAGEVTGVEIGKVTGDVTVESTVNQIEAKIVQGDYVDRKTIVLLGQDGLEQIAKMLVKLQGADKQTLQNLGTQTVPENVSHQIEEVVAAQKEVAEKGVSTTPQATYRLGMLAAYNRDYNTALDYFHQATQTDPEYSDAFEAISWLQQSLAMHDLQSQNYTAAKEKLDEARRAAERTDPLDPNALTQRGYIAKTLAQIAEAMNDQANKQKYYQEAARLFRHVVQLDLGNAGAHNGLGNIEDALGNIDAAITCYNQAIELMPKYTAAYHDLAIAFENKMKTDPTHSNDWCRKALEAWQKTYELAPNDPGFSADYIVTIGQRISWLKQKCGKGGGDD
ncbi:MAG: tetratricopeptide repeat protein [Proteobacteria bacterium]|nr:tetratricopeptide repeat protein [Pseudomonadota bacterium]